MTLYKPVTMLPGFPIEMNPGRQISFEKQGVFKFKFRPRPWQVERDRLKHLWNWWLLKREHG